jgi:hypothetical protein
VRDEVIVDASLVRELCFTLMSTYVPESAALGRRILAECRPVPKSYLDAGIWCRVGNKLYAEGKVCTDTLDAAGIHEGDLVNVLIPQHKEERKR